MKKLVFCIGSEDISINVSVDKKKLYDNRGVLEASGKYVLEEILQELGDNVLQWFTVSVNRKKEDKYIKVLDQDGSCIKEMHFKLPPQKISNTPNPFCINLILFEPEDGEIDSVYQRLARELKECIKLILNEGNLPTEE
jgi:hypothetical protein